MTGLRPGQRVRLSSTATVTSVGHSELAGGPVVGLRHDDGIDGLVTVAQIESGYVTVTPLDEAAPAPVGDAVTELEALAAELHGMAAGAERPPLESAGWEAAARIVAARGIELRAAAPAWAKKWETVQPGDLRVGDFIEVHARCETGERITRWISERVLSVHGDLQLSGFHVSTIGGVVIRRRVRAQMPEPERPAVVRHAGRLLGRSSYEGITRRWVILDGELAAHPDKDGGKLWALTWPEVLALGPGAPVVVDLDAMPAPVEVFAAARPVLDAEPTAARTVVEDGTGVWWGRGDGIPGSSAWSPVGVGGWHPWSDLDGPVRLVRAGGA